MFQELFPILSTADLPRALSFYRMAEVADPDGSRVIVAARG